jgi:hypothetical protein
MRKMTRFTMSIAKKMSKVLLQKIEKQIKEDPILLELYELEKERMGMYWDEKNFHSFILGSSISSLMNHPILMYMHRKLLPQHIGNLGFLVAVKNKKGKYVSKEIGKTDKELLKICRIWGRISNYPKTEKEMHERRIEESKRKIADLEWADKKALIRKGTDQG